MNRRSLFGLLAALPIVGSAFKASHAAPLPSPDLRIRYWNPSGKNNVAVWHALETIHAEIDALQTAIPETPLYSWARIDLLDEGEKIRAALLSADRRICALQAAGSSWMEDSGKFELADRERCQHEPDLLRSRLMIVGYSPPRPG